MVFMGGWSVLRFGQLVSLFLIYFGVQEEWEGLIFFKFLLCVKCQRSIFRNVLFDFYSDYTKLEFTCLCFLDEVRVIVLVRLDIDMVQNIFWFFLQLFMIWFILFFGFYFSTGFFQKFFFGFSSLRSFEFRAFIVCILFWFEFLFLGYVFGFDVFCIDIEVMYSIFMVLSVIVGGVLQSCEDLEK